MTLKETIYLIEKVSAEQPCVKTIVENDVFRLNALQDTRYGVFAFVQGQHSASSDSSIINYAFTFFYVDRLLNDRSNQIEVQSVGIQTLDNIIKSLEEMGIYAETSYNFNTFNQRFTDECAGCFCNVTLSVPSEGVVCPEKFIETWYLRDTDLDYIVDSEGNYVIVKH